MSNRVTRTVCTKSSRRALNIAVEQTESGWIFTKPDGEHRAFDTTMEMLNALREFHSFSSMFEINMTLSSFPPGLTDGEILYMTSQS
jgi:hypothetical protein